MPASLRPVLTALTAISALSLITSAPALAQTSAEFELANAETAVAERPDERVLGRADAPVTFIEYASVACGHCANFHATGYAAVEAGIEAGDIRYVFRPMITGPANLAVAGFMLAECAADDRYFDVIDTLFERQADLFAALQQGEAQAAFDGIAARFGFISTEQVQACLSDGDNLSEIQRLHTQATVDGIASTPSFIINGDHISGHQGEAGPVYGVEGVSLSDSEGEIPADHSVESLSRLIALYKARADG